MGIKRLTDAAEAFLAQADEHVEAEVAVGRPVEVLQPPQMIPVLFDVLHHVGREDEDGIKLSIGGRGTRVKISSDILTESSPRRTRRGMVVMPPRFHSSSETVPSLS